MGRLVLVVSSLALAGLALAVPCRAGTARGDLVGESGRKIGTVTATQVPDGLLVSVDARGLPPGPHGMHLHDTGVCVPPFTSSGGHFNPTGKRHGARNSAGRHLGDLPNVTAAPDGTLRVDIVADGLALEGGQRGLLDGDGTSLVLHADFDDEATDPEGDCGRRIACAVLRRTE